MANVPLLDRHHPALARPARHARLTEIKPRPGPPGGLRVGGLLTARIVVPASDWQHLNLSGVREIADGRLRDGRRWVGVQRPNGFVNLGIHVVLDQMFNLNTPSPVSHMGISDDTTTVTASTTQLDPTPSGDSPAIRTLGTGTGAAATSRTAETTSAQAGWDEADFTTPFSITKVGLLNAATDAADDAVPTVQGICNIIGGTGGGAPYDEPFTVDVTSLSAFDLTFGIDTTIAAT